MWGKKSECARLSVVSLGMALGVTKGLFMLFLAWGGWIGYSMPGMHQGTYAPNLISGLTGGICGFICGFIAGAVIAFLYNLCLCYMKKLS